jgi:putative transcriptional regulator
MIKQSSGYLTGQLIISMPQLQDPRFKKSVIYICGHDKNGAMGLVINRTLPTPTFKDLLIQLNITAEPVITHVPIYFGGPVEVGRGFVLHSMDYEHEASIFVTEDMALTATVDILSSIAKGEGPRQFVLALGYAGWSAGQLDEEILANSWLVAPSDPSLVFDPQIESKWQRAMKKIGVKSALLASESGHA